MTYPLPSNIAQFIAPDGRPLPDFYRWLRQVDQYGIAPVQSLPAGGTTGQALLKDSNTDGDASWHSLGSAALADASDFDAAGAATAAVAAHVAASDPHPQYLTEVEADALYDEVRTPAALTKTDDSNVTLTLTGTPTTALLESVDIAVGWTGALPISRGGTGKTTAGGATLDAISGFSLTGLIARTGSGNYNVRTITAPAAGITVANGDGILGEPTLGLANDLAALEGLSSTGIARRTGSDAWSVGALVSYSEIQDVSATNKLLGRSSSGAGSIEEIDIGVWSTFTPAVSSSSGTITTVGTVSGRYKQIGKLVFYSIQIRITTNGTGAGTVMVTNMPIVSVLATIGNGRANQNSGKMLQASISGGGTTLFIRNYDNTYPASDNELLILSGFYEAA